MYSLEVLNFDRNLIERQIETYKDRLSREQLMELLERSEHLHQILISLRDKLKNGGRPAFQSEYSSHNTTLYASVKVPFLEFPNNLRVSITV